MKLSKRLSAALDMIIPESRIADIGTDHGFVPVQACKMGRCKSAVAVDIAEGPLSAAREHIQSSGMENIIECRIGNGLQCMSPGEVDGALFCGMGGLLICDLLSASPHVFASLKFLVLQPMRDAAELRRFLYMSGWCIRDEKLVFEDGHLYEIMLAVSERGHTIPDWLYEIGPVNWEQRDIFLPLHIRRLIDKYRVILQGLQKSRFDESERIQHVEKHITELEEKEWQCSCKK